MADYLKDTQEYLTDTFETYLELRTDNEEVVFEDLSDFQRFLEQEGVSYRNSQNLDFPPSESEELGELIRFVNEMEVVE